MKIPAPPTGCSRREREARHARQTVLGLSARVKGSNRPTAATSTLAIVDLSTVDLATGGLVTAA